MSTIIIDKSIEMMKKQVKDKIECSVKGGQYNK